MFSTDDKIYKSQLESNVTFKLHNISIFNENDGSYGMDYSINQNLIMYKSTKDRTNYYVSSIGLKSTVVKQFTEVSFYSDNIAIDWIHSLVYFNYANDIHVMNIFNKRMRAIVVYNEIFRDIVVNPLESFIVWSRDKPNTAIIKANQDGSDLKVLIDKDLYNPLSIVIEFETKRIYFMDHSSLKLSSIDFNGNYIFTHQIGIQGFYGSKCLDIYDRNLYVYDNKRHEIMIVSTDGLIHDKINLIDKVDLKTIKIIHSSHQPNGENKCIDSNCTHLCLPNQYTSNKFKCICPEKQYLVPGEICQSVRYMLNIYKMSFH